MRKQLFTLCMVAAVSFLTLQAQTVRSFESSNEQFSMNLHTPDLQVQTQVIASDTFDVLTIEGFSFSTQVGAPQLPVMRQLVEIPLCESVEAKVISANSRTLTAQSLAMDHPLLPLQPARSKSDTSRVVLHKNADMYSRNQMYSNEMVSVRVLGVARDRNLAMVEYSPLSYNPVTGEMELVTDVQLVLNFKNVDLSATRKMKSLHHSGMYGASGVLNELPLSKDVRTAAPVRYLIVAHDSFRGQMDEFVEWKRHQGFLTDIVYTDDPAVGSSNTAIATYLKNQYTNATAECPAPTYVLLVGDHQQIPAFAGRASSVDDDHVTDLYFFTWTTGDDIPDCYYGRFSAQSVAQLTPQISKTLLYEQFGFTDPSYLSKSILVAGVDGGYSGDNAYRYGDPAMDYVAKTYVNSANGFSTVYYYKNNTNFAPSGVTVTGSSQASATATTLRNLYNDGAGWVNYSAHGYDDEWSTPNFTTSHVSRMTNNGKPMFMIGNCCLSNKFNTTYASECLGEALLRKGNDAGAVAYIGGTNSTYWTYDFYWSVGVRSNISNTMDASYNITHLGMYDRLFHTHNESFDKWNTTAGSMIMAGNLAVESAGNAAYSKYYWEIYELMGDPSLMPWLGIPSQMPFSVPDYVSANDIEMTVGTVPHAYVALLTEEGELVSAAFADVSGNARLTWETLPIGTYQVVATAQNYRMATALVESISPSGIKLLVRNFEASNPRVGDVTDFSFALYNKDDVDYDSIKIRLRGNPAKFTAVSGEYTIAHLAAGDSVLLQGVVPVAIDNSVVNGERLAANIIIHTNGRVVELPVRFTVSAPSLAVDLVSVTGTVAAGEDVTLSVRISNAGGADARNVSARLEHYFGMAQVLDTSTTHYPVILRNGNKTLNYSVHLDENVPQVPAIRFDMILSSDNGEYTIPVELPYKSDMQDDFESGNFGAIAWNNNSEYPWTITSSGVHQGQFSARSYNFTSSQNSVQSDLSIVSTSTLPGTVSFYYNVSSENNYDKFYFYIDGTEIFNASGTSNSWTYFSQEVTPGTHTYKFSYKKDYSQSSGSDCAWIDEVTIPAVSLQCSYETDTVCQNVPYSYNGTSIATDQVGRVSRTVSLSDGLHCLLLDVLPQPEVTILASDETVVSGDVLYLAATGASSYLWDFGDTNAMVAVRPTFDTVFTVEGFRGGCSSSAQYSVSVEDGGVSISKVDADVTLYPNPAHDVLNVSVPDLKSITIYDAMGRVVQCHRVSGSTIAVNLKALVPGIYVIGVETSEGISLRKVVKQ